MPRNKSNPPGGRSAEKKTAPPRKTRPAGRPAGRAPAPETSDLTKREVIQWLLGLNVDDIHAVLVAVGRDPDVEQLDLHGGPEELVAQLEGSRPRLENIVAAIEEALGIDESALERQVRGEFEIAPEIDLDEIEPGLEDGFGPDPDEDEFEL